MDGSVVAADLSSCQLLRDARINVAEALQCPTGAVTFIHEGCILGDDVSLSDLVDSTMVTVGLNGKLKQLRQIECVANSVETVASSIVDFLHLYDNTEHDD